MSEMLDRASTAGFGATEVERAIRSVPGLEDAGAQVSRAIHEAVLGGGDLTRAVADLLHGTWLGHPLHAALTDLPIGAWMLAGGFDAYAALSRSREAEWAADRLLAIGVASAIPAALAGLADYSAIKEDAVALGMAHALLNSAGLGLFLGSLWARAAGSRGLGVLLSAAGLATITASASLGGDLAYRKRVGVNHSPAASEPTEWTPVLAVERLVEGEARRVQAGDAPVMLYRDADGIHAIGAVCSHAGGPLEEGRFEGHCVECPWHQSVFDVRTGEVVHGPATHAQPLFETRVRDGQVEVRLVRSGDLKLGAPESNGAAERQRARATA